MGSAGQAGDIIDSETLYLSGFLCSVSVLLVTVVRLIRRSQTSDDRESEGGNTDAEDGCRVVCCRRDTGSVSSDAVEVDYLPDDAPQVEDTCILYELDKLKCTCDVCVKETRLLFNAIYTLRLYTARQVYDSPVGHVKWVLTTVQVDIFNAWNALSEDGNPIWMNYNAQLIELFIIATQDTACITGRVLEYLCEKHLKTKYPRLIQYFVLCAHGAGPQIMFTSPAFLDAAPIDLRNWLNDFYSQPRPLQHHCRLVIRKTLRQNVYNSASKLAIPRCYQRFLCCEDDFVTKVCL